MTMYYKFFELSTLTEELTAKYYPLLSDKRKNLIISMETPYERSVAFCSEILARQCLSELFEAPEFSFKLLLVPNGKSAVGNFNASVSLALTENMIGCAVSKNSIGISLQKNEELCFKDLQNELTDRELRDVFSFSRFSYTELIKQAKLTEPEVCKRAALYRALKQSYFRAKGITIKKNMISVEFVQQDGCFICSDASVAVAEYGSMDNYIFAVTEVII